MKNVKKIVASIAVLAMVLAATAAFATPVYARGWGAGCCRVQGQGPRSTTQAHRYFNAYGAEVAFQPRSLWQDEDGNVMFGRSCWFLDADGTIVSAWNNQVFDADGNPVVWGGQGWGDCCALFWGQ